MNIQIIIICATLLVIVGLIAWSSIAHREPDSEQNEPASEKVGNILVKKLTTKQVVMVLAPILILFFGYFRVYYGGGSGVFVLPKHHFSLSHPIFCMDKIIGMPRIAVASRYPDVKLQLEEYGYMETDEEVQRRIQAQLERDIEKGMAEFQEQYEKNMDELMKKYRY